MNTNETFATLSDEAFVNVRESFGIEAAILAFIEQEEMPIVIGKLLEE